VLLLAAPAAAADQRWPGFQIIVWQPQSAQQYRALKQLGVTAGMLQADRDTPDKLDAARVGALRTAGMRWYVENIATDFYAAYHRWTPDHAVNYRFDEVKQRYAGKPGDPAALRRDPSLSDPRWQQRIRARLSATVRANRPYHPLFYDLGDETGIADLAAYWDFDFSAASLAGFRRWLRHSYASLAALNREWDSNFAAWDEVQPMTTAAAMRRSDGNFAAWADFKAWMDSEFADSLRIGTDAVHAADPGAVAAIEGAQVPGWGGYDYARLATAVDAMEIYDFGENVDIVHSLNPELILMTTSHGGGRAETHRIWREFLRGTRGLILWDDKNELAEQGSARWSAATRQFRDLRSGIGTAIAGGRAQRDAIAILYSPASMRTQWMLDWQPRGDAWSRLDAAAQYDDNALRTAVGDFLHAIQRIGLQPRFVTAELIDAGELARRGIKVLVLPHAVSLGATEAQVIRRFVAAGGTVIADQAPGDFDQHSRKLPQPLLRDLFPAGTATRITHGKGAANLLAAPSAGDSNGAAKLRAVIAEAGLPPAYPLSAPTGEPIGDVEIHRFRNGAVTILALQRDLLDGAAAPGEEPIVVTLPQSLIVSDMRSGKSLGRIRRIELSLGPIEPTLLAISANETRRP
jgi:hypothetical protein